MNMHELGINIAWTVHEVTMIVGMKSMKYGPNFPNFMGVARENLLCFEHAQEPWTIFAWEGRKSAGRLTKTYVDLLNEDTCFTTNEIETCMQDRNNICGGPSLKSEVDGLIDCLIE